MRVPLVWFRPGDVLGAVFIVAVVAFVICFSLRLPWPNARAMLRSTFGPSWECMDVPHSEDICIKKPSTKPAD